MRGRRSPLDRPPQSAESWIQGWFPGFGTAPKDPLDTFPAGRPVAFVEVLFRYRCGGSAGIGPASQLSTPARPVWHPECRQHFT